MGSGGISRLFSVSWCERVLLALDGGLLGRLYFHDSQGPVVCQFLAFVRMGPLEEWFRSWVLDTSTVLEEGAARLKLGFPRRLKKRKCCQAL